jgi:hypothetical protein
MFLIAQTNWLIVASFADYDEEHMLDMNDPLGNPDGIVILRGNNIVVDDQEYDTFMLLVPTWGDVREVTDPQFGIKASISKDGNSIIVTKPRFPLFMTDKIDELWVQEPDGPFDQILNSHNIFANNVGNQAPSSLMKVVRYRLRDGTKIKGGPFNSKSNLELDTVLRYVPCRVGFNRGRPVTAPIPVVYWHVCLDVKARVIVKARNSIDGDAILERMYTALSIRDGNDTPDATATNSSMNH